MKVRHLKMIAMWNMAWNNFPRWMEERSHSKLHTKLVTPPRPAFDMSQVKLEPGPGAKIHTLAAHRPVTEAQVEAAKQEFVVIKKSTGEVVDTFDTRDAADALVEKHRKQKKAALMVKDTLEARFPQPPKEAS
jgi:hypothetical protein